MFLTVTDIPPDVEVQKHLTSLHIDAWIRDDVLRFRWWALLCLILAVLIIWWKMVDKSRVPEIILYVVLAIIVVMGIVEYGEELTLWNYPTDIIPVFPPLTSVNLISLPLIYSIIYQHYKTRKSFIWAAAIITALFCFLIEPLLVWVGFYTLLKWKFYFSYPIYMAMAIGVRSAVIKILAITEKYRLMRT